MALLEEASVLSAVPVQYRLWSPEGLFWSASLALLIGTLMAWFLRRSASLANGLLHTLGVLGSTGYLAAGLLALSGVPGLRTAATSPGHSVLGPEATPFSSFTLWLFRIDPLAAVFLAALGLVGAAACIYAIGYTPAYRAHRSPAFLAGWLNLFLLGMGLLLASDALFPFLVAWETMALASYFLVTAELRASQARDAGFIYAVMTHAGAAALTGAFLLLAVAGGSFGFEGIRAGASSLPGPVRAAAFLLAALGFGTKAGLAPLHVWLPRAHPAAPAHVSALMSAVMLKTAIYGLLRFSCEFLAPVAPAWGAILLAAGLLSMLVAVVSALNQIHLKRLLAYSSIENVGLLFVALGLGLWLATTGRPAAAAVALLALLVHTVNHAAFKGLLFLSAGTIWHAVHTVDLDRLGGLIHRLPVTAACFLAGAVAAAALPPSNGFVGEWLVLRALWTAGALPIPAVSRFALLAALALVALVSALVLVTFAKAFGIGFLALPRTPPGGPDGDPASAVSPTASKEHRVPKSMLAGQIMLAAACGLLGLLAGPVAAALRPVADALAASASGGGPFPSSSAGLDLAVTLPDGSLSPLALSLALGAACGAAWLLARSVPRPRSGRVATWACGGLLQPRMAYSAAGFVQPLHRAFGPRVPAWGQRLEGWVDHWVRAPLVRQASRLHRLQAGNMQFYLLYVFGALIVALWFAR